MEKKMKLTEVQKDALRESGSIGAGHAATALSQLVDRKILISVPDLELVPLPEIPEIVGGAETLVAAVYVRVLGEISGSMLFMLPRDDALLMVGMLKGTKSAKTYTLKERDKELLKQTGNILAASYLNALARFAGVVALPSHPSFAFDMAGAILSSVVAETGLEFEQALILGTTFLEEREEVKARLVFLPDSSAMKVILKKIGVG